MFNIFKGWLGEKSAQLGMWMKLDGNTYKRFHNLILKTNNGTTQIDHVLLSRYGIFVIETKNYNGWIFGGKDQKYWTQVLPGTKNKFQNPLHQNYRHTRVLAEHLNIEHSKIHPVVFFIGDAKLKTEMPPNVLTSGLSNYIKKFNYAIFSDTELAHLEENLTRLHDGQVSTKEHVRDLKERYASTTVCPKCGGSLVKRTAKSGEYAGREFFGCSNFPRCKYVKG